MERFLIVEDDPALAEGVRLGLQSENRTITLCPTLADGLETWQKEAVDLVILDVNLPDGSGLDLLRKIREAGDTPVLLLTANDLETDVVAGLESGADDYITKPFSLAILRARVNTQLRRRGSGPETVTIDRFRFDFTRMAFYKNETPVDLSKTEQRLLRVLVENRGQTVPRATLVDRVWTDGAAYVEENALSVTMRRLRDKLEEDPSKPRYLKTVYGVGYTWAVK